MTLTKTFGFLVPVAAALLSAWSWGCSGNSSQKPPESPANLAELLILNTDELAQLDIARVNLLCARGLPGCEQVRVSNSLVVLDQWAAHVKSETERHNYRYERNPGEFENSRGFYKMLMLGVVLAEDYRVHYCTDRRGGPKAASVSDGFFTNARDVFLPGLLGEERQGTCSSMPVLYAAVGRRLGYPLKLVTTKGHLFLRWEGQGERFNLEVTGNGLNRFSDEYYRTWPFVVSDMEVKAENYLRSLSPADELAAFLSIRAMCLRDAGRMAEAAEAFGQATKLVPEVQSYRMMEGRCRAARNRNMNQIGKKAL